MRAFLFVFIFLIFHQESYGQQVVSRKAAFTENGGKLQLPRLELDDSTKTIIIAIVDDAFYLDHELLRSFIYNNPNENPFNKVDDDLNGFIDDIKGYDVADLDNDPSPPQKKAAAYTHGTLTAGTIVQTLTSIYGGHASRGFKIHPVKAISDSGDGLRMSGGYSGIDYARKSGADIIICAWSGGAASDEEIEIVKKTIAAGIPVVAAAGNTFGDLIQSPADIDGVIAVAAIDHDFKRLHTSAYGDDIDISCYGDGWLAPTSWNDTGYAEFKNTSQASALTGALAAAAIYEHGGMAPGDLERLIKNSAKPIDEYNVNQWGMLGAGLLDAKKLLSPEPVGHNPLLPEGLLKVKVDSTINQSYTIQPDGSYADTRLKLLSIEPWQPNQRLSVRQNETSEVTDISVNDLYQPYKIDGSNLSISSAGLAHGTEFLLSYESTPFDSTTMYCQEINVITSDTISDGSGPNTYANGSNCKWQLYSEEGTRMKIEFEEFETEAGVDQVYIFDGEATQQTNLMARFSGDEIPPVIFTRSNKVLVWFVSDDKVRKEGWRFRASAYVPK